MYRVLLPIGENADHALAAVEAVATLPNADENVEAVLLNVYEGFEVTGEAGRIESEDVWDAENFPDSVDAARDRLDAAGISVSARREHGDPAEEILAVAAAVDADAIVMSARRRSPAGKALFGSTTQSVLVSADRPVTVTLAETPSGAS